MKNSFHAFFDVLNSIADRRCNNWHRIWGIPSTHSLTYLLLRHPSLSKVTRLKDSRFIISCGNMWLCSVLWVHFLSSSSNQPSGSHNTQHPNENWTHSSLCVRGWHNFYCGLQLSIHLQITAKVEVFTENKRRKNESTGKQRTQSPHWSSRPIPY